MSNWFLGLLKLSTDTLPPVEPQAGGALNGNPQSTVQPNIPKPTVPVSNSPDNFIVPEGETLISAFKEWNKKPGIFFLSLLTSLLKNQKAQKFIQTSLSQKGWKATAWGDMSIMVDSAKVDIPKISQAQADIERLSRESGLTLDPAGFIAIEKLLNTGEVPVSEETDYPDIFKVIDDMGKNADGSKKVDDFIASKFEETIANIMKKVSELKESPEILRSMLANMMQWSYSLQNQFLILIQSGGDPGGMVCGEKSLWNANMGWRKLKPGDPNFNPKDPPHKYGILGASFSKESIPSFFADFTSRFLNWYKTNKNIAPATDFNPTSPSGRGNFHALLGELDNYSSKSNNIANFKSRSSPGAYLEYVIHRKRNFTIEDMLAQINSDTKSGKDKIDIQGGFQGFKPMPVIAQKYMTPLVGKELIDWETKTGRKQYKPIEKKDWLGDIAPDSRADLLYNALVKFAQEKKITVEQKNTGSAGGYSEGGFIAIDNMSQGVAKIGTLAHEIAHSMLHFEYNQGSNKWVMQKGKHADIETDADLTAALFINFFGFPVDHKALYLFLSNKREDAGSNITKRKEIAMKTANELINGVRKFTDRKPQSSVESPTVAGFKNYFSIVKFN